MKQQLLLTEKTWKSGKHYVAYNPGLEDAGFILKNKRFSLPNVSFSTLNVTV